MVISTCFFGKTTSKLASAKFDHDGCRQNKLIMVFYLSFSSYRILCMDEEDLTVAEGLTEVEVDSSRHHLVDLTIEIQVS